MKPRTRNLIIIWFFLKTQTTLTLHSPPDNCTHLSSLYAREDFACILLQNSFEVTISTTGC